MFGRKTLPVILQTEVTECGLACLTMIGRYHGHDIDLNVLRKKHLISMTGASLKSVMAIAGGLKLATRPLKVELDQLHKVQKARFVSNPNAVYHFANHCAYRAILSTARGGRGLGATRLRLAKSARHWLWRLDDITRHSRGRA